MSSLLTWNRCLLTGWQDNRVKNASLNTYHWHDSYIRQNHSIFFCFQVKILHSKYRKHGLKYSYRKAADNFDGEQIREIIGLKYARILLDIKHRTSLGISYEEKTKTTILTCGAFLAGIYFVNSPRSSVHWELILSETHLTV